METGPQTWPERGMVRAEGAADARRGAVVTPYAGHALSVMYYRLTQPDLPVLAERTQAWQSVWHEHDLRRDDKAG